MLRLEHGGKRGAGRDGGREESRRTSWKKEGRRAGGDGNTGLGSRRPLMRLTLFACTHMQNTMRGLVEGVAMFFPCKLCSTDFTEQIKESPPR